MTNIELVGWIALAVSILCIVIAQLAYSRDMYWVRRHASRFPMFAVRDGLVDLVADGTLEEDDMAWCAAYVTTNSLLELQKSHSVWAQLRDFLRHTREVKRDPRARASVDQITEALEDRATREPRFKALLQELGKAQRSLRVAQVHWWDIIPMFLLIAILYSVAFIFDPFGRHRRRDREQRPSHRTHQIEVEDETGRGRPLDWFEGVRPNAGELVGWRVHRRSDRAAA